MLLAGDHNALQLELSTPADLPARTRQRSLPFFMNNITVTTALTSRRFPCCAIYAAAARCGEGRGRSLSCQTAVSSAQARDFARFMEHKKGNYRSRQGHQTNTYASCLSHPSLDRSLPPLEVVSLAVVSEISFLVCLILQLHVFACAGSPQSTQ
jgi:hypothetical protein